MRGLNHPINSRSEMFGTWLLPVSSTRVLSRCICTCKYYACVVLALFTLYVIVSFGYIRFYSMYRVPVLLRIVLFYAIASYFEVAFLGSIVK